MSDADGNGSGSGAGGGGRSGGGGESRSGAVPYWRLIAVLASTVPLQPPLAMRLYHAAVDLHRTGAGRARVSGDLAEGEVRRLGKEALIGEIGGPSFEAELDTPTGHGLVRFLVTREGLGDDDPDAPAAAPRTARRLPAVLPN